MLGQDAEGVLDSRGYHRSFAVLIVVLAVMIPVAAIAGWGTTTTSLVLCLLATIGLYSLARRGAQQTAALLALLMVLLLLACEIWRFDGLRNVAVVAVPAVVAFASLLVPRRWFVAVTLCAMAMLTAFQLAEKTGRLDVGDMEPLSWGDFGALLLILLGVAVVVDAQAAWLRHSLVSIQANERALEASERRFRALIENVSEVIAVVSAEGRVEYVSPAIERVLGYQPPERLGIEAWDLVHPDDLPNARSTFERALAERDRPGHIELRMRHQDGSWRWVGLSGRNLIDDPDVGGIVLSYRDITERKRAEEALRASEEKFARMFEANPSPMSISTVEDGRVLEVNAAMVETTGWSRQELVGSTARSRGTWIDWRTRQELLEELRRTGSLRAREVAVRRKDGAVLDWVMSAEAIELDGEPCILWSVMDLTENKRLAEQLQRAQKMEAIGRLAGGVAHDFNNWLTPVVGYSELVLATMDDDDPQRPRVQAILEAGERASELAGQLLRMGRPQDASEPTLLDLNEVVAGSERPLRGLIGDAVELTVELAPGLGPVLADRSQIEQILLNLAVNARDAMPDGGRLRIETRSGGSALEPVTRAEDDAASAETVVLSVSDTGIGMDADTQSKMFEPFFTTKEAGKGTGLGLAMVYAIVQQLGGEVTVDSEPGRGTTFELVLPVAAGEERAEEPEVVEVPAESGRATVLLVEDQRAVREFTEAGLRRYGYEVIAAASGREALDLLERRDLEFDVLLTDVVMPRMSGPELAAELRARRPDCRVVYMSGYTGRALVDEGRVDPSVELLHKPFTAEQLITVIRQALETASEEPSAGGETVVRIAGGGRGEDEPLAG